jgi:hypothetical protein
LFIVKKEKRKIYLWFFSVQMLNLLGTVIFMLSTFTGKI